LAFGCESRGPRSPKPIRCASAPLKKLLRLAANPRVDLWSQDECHFQQHGTRCRM